MGKIIHPSQGLRKRLVRLAAAAAAAAAERKAAAAVADRAATHTLLDPAPSSPHPDIPSGPAAPASPSRLELLLTPALRAAARVAALSVVALTAVTWVARLAAKALRMEAAEAAPQAHAGGCVTPHHASPHHHVAEQQGQELSDQQQWGGQSVQSVQGMPHSVRSVLPEPWSLRLSLGRSQGSLRLSLGRSQGTAATPDQAAGEQPGDEQGNTPFLGSGGGFGALHSHGTSVLQVGMMGCRVPDVSVVKVGGALQACSTRGWGASSRVPCTWH